MGVAESHAIHLSRKGKGRGLRVVRRRLEGGFAAVLFCPKQTVVVEKRLPEATALAAVAVAFDRCDGLLAVVTKSELKTAVAVMA